MFRREERNPGGAIEERVASPMPALAVESKAWRRSLGRGRGLNVEVGHNDLLYNVAKALAKGQYSCLEGAVSKGDVVVLHWWIA